jgi:hypothetical protein
MAGGPASRSRANTRIRSWNRIPGPPASRSSMTETKMRLLGDGCHAAPRGGSHVSATGTRSETPSTSRSPGCRLTPWSRSTQASRPQPGTSWRSLPSTICSLRDNRRPRVHPSCPGCQVCWQPLHVAVKLTQLGLDDHQPGLCRPLADNVTPDTDVSNAQMTTDGTEIAGRNNRSTVTSRPGQPISLPTLKPPEWTH